ncbi:MAG: hypothetical protein C0485_12690 [Pirellula sp.]|nr:hypothetical protein [Pirellula sp.]
MQSIGPTEIAGGKLSFMAIIVLVMLLAFGVGLMSRMLRPKSSSSPVGWFFLLGMALVGMMFFGFFTVRVERHFQAPVEIVTPMPQIFDAESIAAPPPVAPVPPQPIMAGESIEEMWKKLTAPRINLEQVAETATSDAPRVGPSSPQELTEAAKVILSASLPGADPFTQGWLVNAAKSILGMPVSEQEQLELHQAAVEALATNEQSASAEATSAAAAVAAPAPQEAADPFAHSADAMTVSTTTPQPQHDAANLVIAESIAALPKPDWVLNPPKQIGNVRKFVVISDPYLTAEECRQDADEKMQNLALNRAAELSGAATRRNGAASLADLGLGGDYVRRELCTDEYVDVIDSSVGEMRKTYSLVEFNEAQDALLIDRARSYSRQEGLLDVTLIGGGVLASIATLFGLLKVDTWTRGYYTKRLFLGVPAAIITVLTLFVVAGK